MLLENGHNKLMVMLSKFGPCLAGTDSQSTAVTLLIFMCISLAAAGGSFACTC